MREEKKLISVDKLPPADAVLEIFFVRANELCKVVYSANNKLISLDERKRNIKLQYKYTSSINEAKQFRNFYKGIVRDSILPLANVFRLNESYDPGEIDKATNDFRRLILGQFDMLYTRLKDYADLLIPKEGVEDFLKTLEKVYESERQLLVSGESTQGLAYYRVTPKFTKEEQFIGKQKIGSLKEIKESCGKDGSTIPDKNYNWGFKVK